MWWKKEGPIKTIVRNTEEYKVTLDEKLEKQKKRKKKDNVQRSSSIKETITTSICTRKSGKSLSDFERNTIGNSLIQIEK